MQRKVFLSYSFADRDKDVASWFKEIITRSFKHIQLVDASEAKPTEVVAKIFPLIDDSDAVIGILTKRDKIEGKDEWTTVPYVISELMYARGRRKRVVGFYEKGVRTEQTGTIRDIVEIQPFDRKKLNRSFKETAVSYLRGLDVFGKNPPPPVSSYDYLKYRKESFIFNDGCGFIVSRCEIEVKTAPLYRVHLIFSPGASAKKGMSLPHLNRLMREPSFTCINEPFLAFTTLWPENLRYELNEIKGSEKEERHITVNFKNCPLKVGDTLKYEWVWGAPDLVPASKKEMAPGLREDDLDYVESTLKASRLVNFYEGIVNFQEGCKLAEAPQLKLFEQSGDEIRYDFTPEYKKSVMFNSYIFRFPATIPGVLYAIRWQLV
jgi:hypothetical protein